MITLTFFLMMASAASATQVPIQWHAIPASAPEEGLFRVYGLYWQKENGALLPFGRLPLRLRAFLERENSMAWEESLCPSGARVRFSTDSAQVHVRVVHGFERISTHHMAPFSAAGMDLYEGPPQKQVYRGTSNPKSGTQGYEHTYVLDEAKKMREWTLYLPTYARLERLEIGLDQDAKLAAPTEYPHAKPVVFYGTSITQSGSASRGSMGFVPKISRMLGVDVINLGFSGSGLGEVAVAERMAEIDASVYVVDSVANIDMQKNYRPFVEKLRERRPKTPIVLMTRIRFADVMPVWGGVQTDTDEQYKKLHEPLYAAFEAMKKKGDKLVEVFDSAEAIGRPNGDHATVDGIHPNDLGFDRISQKLAPVLKKHCCGAK